MLQVANYAWRPLLIWCKFLDPQRRAFAGVPEFFGKESKYTAGSEFLGVPQNSRDVSSSCPGARQ